MRCCNASPRSRGRRRRRSSAGCKKRPSRLLLQLRLGVETGLRRRVAETRGEAAMGRKRPRSGDRRVLESKNREGRRRRTAGDLNGRMMRENVEETIEEEEMIASVEMIGIVRRREIEEEEMIEGEMIESEEMIGNAEMIEIEGETIGSEGEMIGNAKGTIENEETIGNVEMIVGSVKTIGKTVTMREDVETTEALIGMHARIEDLSVEMIKAGIWARGGKNRRLKRRDAAVAGDKQLGTIGVTRIVLDVMIEERNLQHLDNNRKNVSIFIFYVRILL